MKIIITGTAPIFAIDELHIHGHEIVSVADDALIDEDFFCKNIKEFDIYISGGIERCTSRVISAAERLKAIIFLGVEYKNFIDAAAAARKGIPIFNTPGANARAVAEWASLLMLMAARHAHQTFLNSANKIWAKQAGFELKGKTLALIGAGRIAAQMAEIGLGLGMTVKYWNQSGPKARMNGTFRPFDQLLAESEILSLHVSGEAGTMLDRIAFAKMTNTRVLVNTGRANLVDAAALYDALAEGRLGTAAFDVFYTEGPDAWRCPEAKLFDLGPDRFFVSPHAAWNTIEARDNMFKQALQRIKEITP